MMSWQMNTYIQFLYTFKICTQSSITLENALPKFQEFKLLLIIMDNLVCFKFSSNKPAEC